MFFNSEVQMRYGYNAKDYVGRLNLLPLIGRFKILNDPSLVDRIQKLTKSEAEAMIEDIDLYLDGTSAIKDSQRTAERSKLDLISNINPLNDKAVVDRFIQVLRTSNEHTDYLDWADSDKLNIPLIQYLISLTEAELQGF
jgi:hypothetical protein